LRGGCDSGYYRMLFYVSHIFALSNAGHAIEISKECGQRGTT